MAHLLISVGTNFNTFDDLTISVHDEGGSKGAAILSPEDTRQLIYAITAEMGHDNGVMWKIQLHPTRKNMDFSERFELLSKLETERE